MAAETWLLTVHLMAKLLILKLIFTILSISILLEVPMGNFHQNQHIICKAQKEANFYLRDKLKKLRLEFLDLFQSAKSQFRRAEKIIILMRLNSQDKRISWASSKTWIQESNKNKKCWIWGLRIIKRSSKKLKYTIKFKIKIFKGITATKIYECL